MNDYDRKVKSDSDPMTVLLAGDIGGTKTQLGAYDAETSPPTPLGVRCFKTLDFKGLSPIVEMFLGDRRESVAAACFGVAGPVRDQAAQLTNIPWRVEADALAKRFNIPHVWLLNDLAATGYAVSALGRPQLEVLQAGNPSPTGNAALIAANKDFDLLLFPNRGHGFGGESYMIRRRWDYFVRHLLGVAPPREYRFKTDTRRRRR